MVENKKGFAGSDFGGYGEIMEEFKQSEEKRKRIFRKSLPSYIWLTVKDLFSVLVILGIFSIASNQFESVVFSLLVLIYLSVEGFFSSYGYKTMQVNIALFNEFLQVKKLLKYEENEAEKGKADKIQEAYSRLETHIQIHSIFLLLLFLIALGNIIKAII